MNILKFIRSTIRQKLVERLGAPEMFSSLKRLAAVGFHPELIFDVGAYEGEFAKGCLRIWPKARVACFEPLKHKVDFLRRLSSSNSNLQVFECLLGAQEKESVVFHEAETASSVLEEHTKQNFPVTSHSMTTVDEVVGRHYGDKAPDLIKLDTQGYELEVLKGSEKSLPAVTALILEVNFLDIHKGVPLAGEVIQWLDQRGWAPYDICGLHRRPLDRALWQADLMFVKRDSKFRIDKRWI